MQVQVLFFAAIRDQAGRPEVTLDMPDGATVSDLSARLKELYPAARPLLSVCRFASGDHYAGPADHLIPAESVAVIPPVSGGQGCPVPEAPDSGNPRTGFPSISEGGGSDANVHAEIVRSPIAMAAHVSRVSSGVAGAVLTFAGTVRADHEGSRAVVGIEYEGHEPMALKMLQDIAASTAGTHGVVISVAHRLGRLAVGEISVGIAVAAAHRGTGFTALREVIERIKADLPIWKKEEFLDGATAWVGAQEGGRH